MGTPTERELLEDIATRAIAWLWPPDDTRSQKDRQDDLAIATDRLVCFRKFQRERTERPCNQP